MKASTTLNGYMLIDDKKATVDQIDTIIAERDNALAQNAELVAQVENLKSSLIFVASVFSGDNAKEHAEYIDWSEIHNLISKTPAQHLRDRDAEKGRAAFVAGFYKAKQVYDCELGQCATDLDEMASDYAERVKAGE
jgi:hypothetical protein